MSHACVINSSSHGPNEQAAKYWRTPHQSKNISTKVDVVDIAVVTTELILFRRNYQFDITNLPSNFILVFLFVKNLMIEKESRVYYAIIKQSKQKNRKIHPAIKPLTESCRSEWAVGAHVKQSDNFKCKFLDEIAIETIAQRTSFCANRI